jgi:hypothetical protein
MTITLTQAVEYYFRHRHDPEQGRNHRAFCRMYLAALRRERSQA